MRTLAHKELHSAGVEVCHVVLGRGATLDKVQVGIVLDDDERSEEEARTMIVNGFANPVSKELPLEYAVEMNNLIKLEMEGAIG